MVIPAVVPISSLPAEEKVVPYSPAAAWTDLGGRGGKSGEGRDVMGEPGKGGGEDY